jgi:hypothetical protein
MHKAQIAQLILSLFTSRERAAATVGDLLESTRERGAFWFWSCVARTALSLLWTDFAAEPSFLALLGLRGILVNLSLLLAWFIAMMVFIVLSGIPLGLIVGPLLPRIATRFIPMFEWAAAISVSAVGFQTGRWIARRARGREIAACIVFLILQTIVMAIVGEALFGGERGSRILAEHPQYISISDLSGAWKTAAVFIGAIWVRFRSGESLLQEHR